MLVVSTMASFVKKNSRNSQPSGSSYPSTLPISLTSLAQSCYLIPTITLTRSTGALQPLKHHNWRGFPYPTPFTSTPTIPFCFHSDLTPLHRASANRRLTAGVIARRFGQLVSRRRGSEREQAKDAEASEELPLQDLAASAAWVLIGSPLFLIT